MHFFIYIKHKLEVKIFTPFFVANSLLCSNIFTKKNKFCMQNLIFCVYNVVQGKFSPENPKIAKIVFFCKHNYCLLFYMLR